MRRGLSEEAKRHLSLFWKGKKKSKEHALHIKLSKMGEKNPLYGVKPSKETLEKRSRALKGKIPWNKGKKWPEKSGANAPGWKGGVSIENELARHGIEFRLWREAVYARDAWTCRKCRIRGGKLHPHHIQNFSEWPELRFAIDNGITLCVDCHKAFHKKYGQRKNNRAQITKYLYYGHTN